MPVSRARRFWLIALTVVLSALALGLPNEGPLRRAVEKVVAMVQGAR